MQAPEGLLGGLGLALGDLLLAHRAHVTALLHRRGGDGLALDLHGGPTALATGGHAAGAALAVRTAPEAALLAKTGGKALAGGQSLVAAMRLRLAQPGTLIELSGIADLKGMNRDARAAQW